MLMIIMNNDDNAVCVTYTVQPTPGLHHKISIFSDPDPGKS